MNQRPVGRRSGRFVVAVAALAVLVGSGALEGCATTRKREPRPVPIERRPTPPPASAYPRDGASQPLDPARRQTLLREAVRDSASAGARLRRCAGRRLLPDQESIWDAAAGLLAQPRAALLRGDVSRARSLARNARQLVTSLRCR